MFNRVGAALEGDDRAVSPMISAVLMVAITVILAATVASMSLGFGDTVQQAPMGRFGMTQQGTGSDAVVTISYDGGQTFDTDRLSLYLDETKVGSGSQYNEPTVSAGFEVKVSNGGRDGSYPIGGLVDGVSLQEGVTVNVVWTSEDGSRSSVLATHTVR